MVSKKSIIILVVIMLLSIVLLCFKRCTGERFQTDFITEIDTLRIDSSMPAKPVDSLGAKTDLEVKMEENSGEKKILEPIRKKAVPVDTIMQEISKEKIDIYTFIESEEHLDPEGNTEEKTEPKKEESVSEEREKVPHVEEVSQLQTKVWKPQFHLKTNAIGWGMGMTNIAVEFDLSKHWSFQLPVYYSAWNYFDKKIKFRTFAVQPELRYWYSEGHQGLFAGAHLGMAYYNVAWGGDFRYQDHDRKTPAVGGGISVGYRKSLVKSERWKVECSLGAGVYSLHYDKFHNKPDVKEGLMVDTAKKTFVGIDQASVSFTYSFYLSKKGGQK